VCGVLEWSVSSALHCRNKLRLLPRQAQVLLPRAPLSCPLWPLVGVHCACSLFWCSLSLPALATGFAGTRGRFLRGFLSRVQLHIFLPIMNNRNHPWRRLATPAFPPPIRRTPRPSWVLWLRMNEGWPDAGQTCFLLLCSSPAEKGNTEQGEGYAYDDWVVETGDHTPRVESLPRQKQVLLLRVQTNKQIKM
jgi:hypothetical protein